jgi:hypothetical protein
MASKMSHNLLPRPFFSLADGFAFVFAFVVAFVVAFVFAFASGRFFLFFFFLGAGRSSFYYSSRSSKVPGHTMKEDVRRAARNTNVRSGVPMPTYLHELASTLLNHDNVHHHGVLESSRRDMAIAACGVGCDHLDGERIVAVIDDTPRQHVFVGAVITDRRYAWRNLGGLGSVLWSDVESVRVRDGLLIKEQVFKLCDGNRVRVPSNSVDLSAFFAKLAVTPFSVRCSEPRPLTMPPPRKPESTKAQAHSCSDPRHRLMYETVWELHAREGESAISRDLCGRVSVLHRTTHEGRGESGGWWLSPLAPLDMLHALDAVLQRAGPRGTNDGHRYADYALPERWCAETVLDGTALQVRTLREAGFGRELSRIRVTVQAAPDGAAFAVQGFEAGAPVASLTCQNPALLSRLFSALVTVEQRALLRRILGGWRLPMAELLDQPVEQLLLDACSEPLPLQPARFHDVGLA